jgi:transposase-like protein
MTILCKFCNSAELVKNGIIYEKQRYKCKKCKKTFRIGEDLRKKYDLKIKHLALAMHLENSGIRAISRVINQVFGLKISNTMILKYIKKTGQKVELENDKSLRKKLKNKEKIDIEVLEMDELYTFVKKNPKKSLNLLKKSPTEAIKSTINMTENTYEFGLLWTATAMKLLRLR